MGTNRNNKQHLKDYKMKRIVLLFLVGIICISYSQSEKAIQESSSQKFTDLKGDYLGQTPPGDVPVIFASGIISVDSTIEHWAPTFSPDGNEVFWWTIRKVIKDNTNEWYDFHKTMRRIGDKWTAPEKSPYDLAPVFSPDGKRLYFGSKKEGDNPYFVEKLENIWSKPNYIDIITRFPELRYVYFQSISCNGTLYFLGYLEGAELNLGIYRTEFVNGKYAKPELLPPSINTLDDIRNWTPFIASDESYLLFCSNRGLPESESHLGDLYVSFRQPDGSWMDPVSLGEQINSKGLERFPGVSPDGKYLFFTRQPLGGSEDVYWVSADIINEIKTQLKGL